MITCAHASTPLADNLMKKGRVLIMEQSINMDNVCIMNHPLIQNKKSRQRDDKTGTNELSK